ncbi:MAG: glycosyltransferase family 4 protein [Pirellula sp.]
MRIVHIITRMIVGGAQENTRFNCLDLIREHGDDVTLITGPSLGAEGSLLDQTDDRDLKVVLVPSLIRSIRPHVDVGAYRDLKRLLEQLKPDVVHTHSAKAGMLGRAAAWKLRVPCVVHTVHGAPFHPFQSRPAQWFFQACERWGAKRCHRMISVADAMTDLMVSARVAPRERFTTIYSGMDVEPFLAADSTRESVRQQLGIRPEHVVVGKIARLFHLKGHEYLFEAARSMVHQYPHVRFLLVGDGILRADMEQTLRRMKIREHFIFTGLVPPERIPSLVGAMDMVAHVSLREGLARAIPQGLIAGKPVVSYDIDGAREVVIDNVTGYLLPPKSTHELADALGTLVRAPELRHQMGTEGRRRFTDVFRHQSMTQRIRQLYQEVLGQRSPASP